MQGLKVGWATLRSLPALAWLITGLTVSNIATGTLQAAAPVLIVQQMGHTSASVGLIWSAAAAASSSPSPSAASPSTAPGSGPSARSARPSPRQPESPSPRPTPTPSCSSWSPCSWPGRAA